MPPTPPNVNTVVRPAPSNVIGWVAARPKPRALRVAQLRTTPVGRRRTNYVVGCWADRIGARWSRWTGRWDGASSLSELLATAAAYVAAEFMSTGRTNLVAWVSGT